MVFSTASSQISTVPHLRGSDTGFSWLEPVLGAAATRDEKERAEMIEAATEKRMLEAGGRWRWMEERKSRNDGAAGLYTERNRSPTRWTWRGSPSDRRKHEPGAAAPAVDETHRAVSPSVLVALPGGCQDSERMGAGRDLLVRLTSPVMTASRALNGASTDSICRIAWRARRRQGGGPQTLIACG